MSTGTLFEQLQLDGKRLAAEGMLVESLKKFEEAKRIMETPKILNRIQKLKDAISRCDLKNSQNLPDTKFKREDEQKETNYKLHNSCNQTVSTPRVLSQINNLEDTLNKRNVVITNPAELSPEKLKMFNKLKESAMDRSYCGKFKEALEAFTEAFKICSCPKIKKYIQEMETMISKHEEKIQKFQHLSDTGKRLASEGRPTESLKKFKEAYAVCPSPKISKIIKMLEVKPDSPANSPSESSESNEDFVLPKVEPRKVESGSSNSDDSNFQSPQFKETKKKTADPSALTPDRKTQFKNLYTKARENAASGNLKVALEQLIKAKAICPTEKILKRIKDLKEHIKSTSEEEESDKMIAVADGFYVFHEIYEKLYPYQRLGVAWMWELFKKGKGGVLGDDMGLGKTFQVIAFLSGLIDADHAKSILCIMPVSLLTNWENEFQKWCPGISVCVFHGGSKKERERNILRVQRKGHVLLTSYGMVLNSFENLAEYDGRQFIWDYVILDEGHKIKNPTKTTKAVHNIPAKNRLVLTGTPIQNNLRELWALYDFSHQGTLLGSMKTFKLQYENPITRAREKDATVGEKRLGTEMAENLRMLMEPYFLRRTKAEIWGKPGEKKDIDDLNQSMDQLNIDVKKVTTRKNDLIVWTFLSEAQIEIYQSFLSSETVKMTLVSKRSPLVELTTLKKICDHPRLLSQRACVQLGLNGNLSLDEINRHIEDEAASASSIENVTDDTLIAESGKMKFLICLLANLKKDGHRTLVFSLSRKILDMVHRILVNRGWKVMRLDGTITKMEERERRIQAFQTDSSYSVFLLTTQVGGVGITLTAADRVVIYDPSWNPATDAQAVDRVYRIGQQKNVVVYRLITCGTVEEKIYRRQIFKDSITKQVTGTADPNRYFSKQELRELFTLDNPNHSATQTQLSVLHSDERQSDVSLDAHIAFLHSLNIFGISDHDLMFTKDIVDDTEDNDEQAVSHDYIKKQVAMARELIRVEGSVVEEGMRLAGAYTKPYLENIPTYKKNSEKDSYKPPSVTKMTYPDSPPSLTKSSPVTDQKKSSFNETGNQFKVSEIIDLCDSPQKPQLATTYGESEHMPRASRRSGKLYEPLTLEKNKISNYFPVTTDTKIEENTSKTGNRSLHTEQTSPETYLTPNKQNNDSIISIYETPNIQNITAGRDSVFENEIDGSPNPSVAKGSFEEQLAASTINNHLQTSKNVSISKNEQSISVANNQHLVEENYSIHDASLHEDQSLLEENEYNQNVSAIDQSMSEEVPDYKESAKKDQSMQEESGYEHNLSNTDQSMIEDKPEHNESHVKDQSMLEESGYTHNLSVTDRSMIENDPDLNESATKDQSMLEEDGHYPNASVGDQSMLEDVQDQSVIEDVQDQSVIEDVQVQSVIEYVLDDKESEARGQTTFEANVSMDNANATKHESTFEETASNNDTSAINDQSLVKEMSECNTPLPGNSARSELSIEEIAKEKLSFVANDCSMHLEAGDTGSNPHSPNLSEPGTYLHNSQSNMKKNNLSFDLDSSLYDTESYPEQPVVIRNTRKSCAIQQPFTDDESDESTETSQPNSEDEVIESDSEFDSDDSIVESNASMVESNASMVESNASLSFVASSIPNSPYVGKDTHPAQNLSPRRRITPLRLRNSFVSPPNHAFAMAVATSPMFTPVTSSPLPNNRGNATMVGSFSEEDSPVKMKKGRRCFIESDSEED